MQVARGGDYVPPGWQPGPDSPDVHAINEGRGWKAERRLHEICAIGARDHDWIIER